MNTVKLNLNKDFRRLYGRGQSHVAPALVTYVIQTRRGVLRYGVTTAKKVGCAVMRNRARRVIEAAARTCFKQADCNGADIVFVARTKTPFMKSTDILSAMKTHLIDAGVIPAEKQ